MIGYCIRNRRVAQLRTSVFIGVFASLAFVMMEMPTSRASTPPHIRAVGDARLDRARIGDDSWLTYGHDRGALRFSTLRQIGTNNVGALGPAWTTKLSDPDSLEGTPLIADGVMYATTGKDVVVAIDARTGTKLWQFTYPLPVDVNSTVCCNFNNRGVTLAGDLVVTETLDAHLVALDRRTGKVRYDITVADYHRGYSITSPPLYAQGMLITGVAGGEYPIRGFLAAFDASTGAKRWQLFTVPEDSDGGSTWVQGTFDPQSQTLYWGVGNHNPLFTVARDALSRLADSLVAIDVATGRIKWRYAFTPGDIWDYDGVNEPVLVDIRRGKRTIAAIAQANRNGYLYVFERASGRLLYAEPFVSPITWGRVDRYTGAVRLNAAMQRAAAAGTPIDFYPSTAGGKNWGPTATDPHSGVMFVPSIENGERLFFYGRDTRPPTIFTNVRRFFGSIQRAIWPPAIEERTDGYTKVLPGTVAHGAVEAFDLSTGRRLWRTPLRTPILGGLLATSGGLVIGGSPEGKLLAFDARDGRLVWSERVPGGITAPPITYAIAGRQYIAVEVGIGGAWPAIRMDATPWLRKVPMTSLVCTFALPNRIRATTVPHEAVRSDRRPTVPTHSGAAFRHPSAMSPPSTAGSRTAPVWNSQHGYAP